MMKEGHGGYNHRDVVNRRKLILGLGALIAAPAIVRASSLMPVRAWREPMFVAMEGEYFRTSGDWRSVWDLAAMKGEINLDRLIAFAKRAQRYQTFSSMKDLMATVPAKENIREFADAAVLIHRMQLTGLPLAPVLYVFASENIVGLDLIEGALSDESARKLAAHAASLEATGSCTREAP